MNVFPPKRILVAFDFTDRTLAAWRYAEALARRVGASLEAVYVRPSFLGPEVVMPTALTAGERSSIRAEMASLLGRGRALHVEDGDVVLGILRAARARRAGLIVVGTAGLTGLARLRRSSVAEDLVRSSPVPVLTVRGEARLPKAVLAPVNLRSYSFQGLAAADRVARVLGGHVTLLHVTNGHPGRPLGRLLVESRGARSGPVALLTAPGAPVARILEAATRFDLVVLVAHRGGLLRAAILGTTAEQVLRRCPVPVLSVPPAPEGRRGPRRR
jgi:nucleotide-binding universal stress UspA family protein